MRQPCVTNQHHTRLRQKVNGVTSRCCIAHVSLWQIDLYLAASWVVEHGSGAVLWGLKEIEAYQLRPATVNVLLHQTVLVVLLCPHRVYHDIEVIHVVALALQDTPTVLPDILYEVSHSWVIGEVVRVVHRIKLMHVMCKLLACVNSRREVVVRFKLGLFLFLFRH